MKLIIVPRWLEQTLAANALPLSTVTDVKKILSITSAEDVSVYAKVNAGGIQIGNAVYRGCYDITEQALHLGEEHNRVVSYMAYLDMKESVTNQMEHLIGRNYVEGAPLCYSCTVLDDEYIVITLGQHEVGTPVDEVLNAQRLFKERLFGQHLLTKKLPDLAMQPVFTNYLNGLCA